MFISIIKKEMRSEDKEVMKFDKKETRHILSCKTTTTVKKEDKNIKEEHHGHHQEKV